MSEIQTDRHKGHILILAKKCLADCSVIMAKHFLLYFFLDMLGNGFQLGHRQISARSPLIYVVNQKYSRGSKGFCRFCPECFSNATVGVIRSIAIDFCNLGMKQRRLLERTFLFTVVERIAARSQTNLRARE
jgi:hypothetical protein